MSGRSPKDYPRKASRLFVAMSRSTAGWSADNLETLLTGFGFVKRDSGGHTFYRHPTYPGLALAVPRTRRLRPYLVADAVQIIGRLLALQAEEPE